MNDTIKAIVVAKASSTLTLEQLKLANEYITAGRTADFTSAMTGWLQAGTRIVDYKEYLVTVRVLFYRLPKDAMLDGVTSWPRWIEHYFKAYEKNKKDYINQLARPKKESKNSPPETKTKPDSDTKQTDGPTYQQLSREIVASDYSVEGLMYLANTINDELQRKHGIANDFEQTAAKSALVGTETLDEKYPSGDPIFQVI
jgi:phenolic acid decarboxylase